MVCIVQYHNVVDAKLSCQIYFNFIIVIANDIDKNRLTKIFVFLRKLWMDIMTLGVPIDM